MKLREEADFDPDKTYTSLVKAGEDWADANAAADALEETKKSVLAKLMLESGGKTNAEKEMLGLADERYTEFVNGMTEARRTANKLRVRYDSAKTLAELRRSQEATKRAEAMIR